MGAFLSLNLPQVNGNLREVILSPLYLFFTILRIPK